MARWIVDDPVHPRRALFLRTQAPFVLVVLILIVVGYTLGLSSDRGAYTVTGILLLSTATIVSIAAPWERLPHT